MLKLASILILASCAFAQLPSNLDCKCKATGADKYTCECTIAKSANVAPKATTAVRPQPVVPPPLVPPPPTKAGFTITAAGNPAAEVANRTVVPPAAAVSRASETPTGEATSKGQSIYTGPKGGQYHYSDSGKKVYTRKK
jgi:hypothetical protein